MACDELLKYGEYVEEAINQQKGEDSNLINKAIMSIVKKGMFFLGYHYAQDWLCYGKRRAKEILPESDEGSFMMANEDPEEDMRQVHLFGKLLAQKTGLEVEMKKYSSDDFAYTLKPREGFVYIVKLRLTEHLLPTKVLDSGAKVVTNLWLKIWFLQYLSLPFYCDEWKKYYKAAVPVFASAKTTEVSAPLQLGAGEREGTFLEEGEREGDRISPEKERKGTLSPRQGPPFVVSGALVTGIDAVRAYAEIVGEKFELPLNVMSYCVVNDFNNAYLELSKRADKPVLRGGIENIFQRKVFGKIKNYTVNLYDCTDHCMAWVMYGGKKYSGFYSTLLFLHYELLVWKHYAKNAFMAKETFKAITAAAKYRDMFLEEKGLLGYEPECGLFRVFDVECIGKDQEDVIKFRKSKWKNKKLEKFGHYKPYS